MPIRPVPIFVALACGAVVACGTAPADPPAPLAAATYLGPCVTPTPDPRASAPGFGCTSGILSGTVLDPAGKLADGALVQARSLDASVPYTATATTFAGQWVINNLPYGARIEVLAHAPGWVTARYEVMLDCDDRRRNILHLEPEPVLPPLPTPDPSPSSVVESGVPGGEGVLVGPLVFKTR